METQSSFSDFLGTQRWLIVLRAIYLADGVGLRELVDLTGISPAGISDILRRLRPYLAVTKQNNRKIFRLKVGEETLNLLLPLFDSIEKQFICGSTALISKRSANFLRWNEEMSALLVKGKRSLGRRDCRSQNR